jgi:acyl carrier protein
MIVKEQICQFLAENFLFSSNGFELGDDVSLLEEGVIDSTGVLELVMFVEESFGLQVPDEEIVPANFDTVNNLAAYIQRKQG